MKGDDGAKIRPGAGKREKTGMSKTNDTVKVLVVKDPEKRKQGEGMTDITHFPWKDRHYPRKIASKEKSNVETFFLEG
jgi:hypothetical protein